jgi:excisionase family DNA binding protein
MGSQADAAHFIFLGTGFHVITASRERLLGEVLTRREVMDPSELLDIAGAAELLGVSETSLRRWTNSGRLPCLRVGQRRERRFLRGDLLAFLEQQPSRNRIHAEIPANPTSLFQRPSTLTHGSHLCGLYASDLGRITLAVPFLADGLNEGSVCLVVGPERTRKQILRHLRDRRPSLHADIDGEKLIQSDYHAAFRNQLRYFRALIAKRAAEGAPSFRVWGDLLQMRSRASEAKVVEYEAAYDQMIARNFPVVTLCAYDVRKFSGVEVLNALKGHRDTFRYPLERALA